MLIHAFPLVSSKRDEKIPHLVLVITATILKLKGKLKKKMRQQQNEIMPPNNIL